MLAHAVLSAFPRFLFFLFLFFFLETSSSAGRWAMGFGKELRKQLRKWLMAADKPDSSTPCSKTPKSAVEDTGTTPTLSLTQSQSYHKEENLPREEEEGSIFKWNYHRQNLCSVREAYTYTHRYIAPFGAATWDRGT